MMYTSTSSIDSQSCSLHHVPYRSPDLYFISADELIHLTGDSSPDHIQIDWRECKNSYPHKNFLGRMVRVTRGPFNILVQRNNTGINLITKHLTSPAPCTVTRS